ncbi:MAG: DUF58 domain-containing protein [Clostridiales Family XIII bacterium]|jgi:uncharacterized protein (DUF58 family)|nr:DUF58 domain-containing protein [Clostridiales Family XIII bacterium]
MQRDLPEARAGAASMPNAGKTPVPAETPPEAQFPGAREDDGFLPSLLVHPACIAAWFILCVAAALYGKTALALFLGFIFLLTLSSLVWARLALRDVAFDLQVGRTGLFPGQSFTVARIIRNRKALPLIWAEIRESCSLSDCALPDSRVIVRREDMQGDERVTLYERLYTASLIKWRHSVRFTDVWEARRRGILRIGEATLRSGDGFGLCAVSRRFSLSPPRQITVYPRLADVSVQRILNDMWDTRSASGGYLKDRSVIKSTRDYAPGDPARDINMRLLARGLSMKTNVHEVVSPDAVLFVLDPASFRAAPPDDFETALSILASLIDALTRRGVAASLMTPASEWFPETCTAPAHDDRGRFAMFELLAAASQKDSAFSGKMSAGPDLPGRVYYTAYSLPAISSPRVLDSFPEHKTQLLLADDSGAAALFCRPDGPTSGVPDGPKPARPGHLRVCALHSLGNIS